jgi:hypothetical protein
MKIEISLLFIFVILLNSCNSQNRNSKESELNNNKGDVLTVNQVKAFYFINKTDKSITAFKRLDTINPIDLDEVIENNLKLSPNLFTIEINKKIIELRLKEKISKWIKIKNIIDNAIDKSENVDYLEFFYKNSKTKNLFNKYLTNKISQDWGSLSSSDSYRVSYDIITAIYELDNQNQKIIISSFYNFMEVSPSWRERLARENKQNQ